MPKTDVKVKLVGNDGNAFFIIGRVAQAMQRGGVPKDTIDAYKKEAMSGDYNKVLTTSMDYVEVS